MLFDMECVVRGNISFVHLKSRDTLIAGHLCGGLVFPQSLEGGMPQVSVAGPLTECYLGNKLGLHPMEVAFCKRGGQPLGNVACTSRLMEGAVFRPGRRLTCTYY